MDEEIRVLGQNSTYQFEKNQKEDTGQQSGVMLVVLMPQLCGIQVLD